MCYDHNSLRTFNIALIHAKRFEKPLGSNYITNDLRSTLPDPELSLFDCVQYLPQLTGSSIFPAVDNRKYYNNMRKFNYHFPNI